MKQCPHCKKYIRTAREEKLINKFRRWSSITARNVADYFGITIANASTMLKKLHTQGLFHRREQVESTGGVEYLYYWAKGVRV